MNQPLWLTTVSIPSYPALTQDIDADICIVGAGITGITLAYQLRSSGLKIVLIDAGKILHGTTAHTTAKLTAQHDICYRDLIKNFGAYNAELYAIAQREAIDFVNDSKIDCDLEQLTAYVYTQKEDAITTLVEEYEAAKTLGFNCELVSELELPFPIKKALAFHDQAQFNPLKFLVGLLKEIEKHPAITIYEQTAAVEINQLENSRYQIKTENYQNLNVRKVVQACHFPFYDGGSLLFAKIEARKSYLVATKEASQKLNGIYISYDKPTRTMRQYENFLIVGGEDHRVGTSENTVQKFENICRFVKEYFHTSVIEHQWSAQDYLTVDNVPFVGAINDSDIYVATGYKKWGMTNGIAAALLLHDLLLGIDNSWAKLFSPHRFNLRAQIRNLIVYNGRVAYELIKGKLQGGEDGEEAFDLEVGQSKIIKTADGKYGIYKDPSGEVYMLDITCPHLGCELNFNHAEKTWDCPCHGSRFTYQGDVVEGPAHHNLQPDKNQIDPNLF